MARASNCVRRVEHSVEGGNEAKRRGAAVQILQVKDTFAFFFSFSRVNRVDLKGKRQRC
jgi:hypothetical protein